jgi:DNA primase
MLQIGETTISADVEDIIEQIQEDTGLLHNVNELETDIMCTCPIHKGGMERTPSLGINKETGVVHCFTCGYKGDIITLVSDCYNITYNQAYRKLVGNYVYSGKRSIDVSVSRDTNSSMYINRNSILPFIKNNFTAWNYLYSRGIDPYKLKNVFPIGYDSNSSSAIFYVRDLNGNYVGSKARSVQGKRFANSTGAKKSTYLYGAYELLQSAWQPHDPVWICESEIDALTVWSRGGYAVAIGGSHISRIQLSILTQLGVRRVIDGLDKDEAGREGWKNFCTYVKGISTYNTKYPVNKKDINDLTDKEFFAIKIY